MNINKLIMSEINLRFKAFIEKTGFTPSKFAVEIGVNHESVNRVARGIDLLPSVNILLASKQRFPILNVNHILTGEDRLFLPTVDSEKIIKELEETISKLKQSMEEKDTTIGNLAATLRNIQQPSLTHEPL